MKITYNWIKQYVDIKVKVEELAEVLTMSGSEVGSIEEVSGEKVLEMEITSNRPDCLNVLGLAREAGAVLDKDIKLPDMSVQQDSSEDKIECVIEDKKLCSKYTARVIKDVKVKGSDKELLKYIEAVGMRGVNNIVDITNFCLMELGQPMHAFDLDKIKGDKIIVRQAKKGEKILTIDEDERELDPGMLVIADASGPIAIAGVMGGKSTEVTEETKNILLESAYFDPISVRHTSRKLGLSSDSSYRFERGVDKAMIGAASDRAAKMIKDLSGGEICGFYETGDLKIEENIIEFNIEKAAAILGVDIDKEWIMNKLQRLGMMVKESGPETLTVTVPSFRDDIKRDIDITEEVARIYGYDNIPATLPKITPSINRKEKERLIREKVTQILSSLGLNEIMTYSLINEEAALRFSDIVKNPVTLSNPLSEEHKVLTTQLVDGMLKSISWNINRKNNDLKLFEVGKIYSKPDKGKGYTEKQVLCVGVTGLAATNWMDGSKSENFYTLKGLIETLFSELKLEAKFSANEMNDFSICSDVLLKDADGRAGFIAQVSKRTLGEYNVEQEVYICQFILDDIYERVDLKNNYTPIARYPFSVRDISILSDSRVRSGDIFDLIEKTGEGLIRDVNLIDVYEGENIPAGKRSLTYSIKYGLDDRTLKEEEIEQIHSKIKDKLSAELKVSFR